LLIFDRVRGLIEGFAPEAVCYQCAAMSTCASGRRFIGEEIAENMSRLPDGQNGTAAKRHRRPHGGSSIA